MRVFEYLIFPGLFFSLFIGGVIYWLERKITARFHFRVGPPWYQNFIDILKLFYKETIVPKEVNKFLFIISPIMSMFSMALLSILLGEIFFFNRGFIADIFVILYLLIMPSLFLVLGGLASCNPLALVGALREMKMVIAYEFVFVCSVVISLIKSGGSIMLSEVINSQMSTPHLFSISGIIAFILSIFYFHAKLGIVPFDLAEAEQEIMGGVLVEYSGWLLAFWKISKVLMYYVLSLLLISLFWPKGSWHILYKFLLIILIVSVIKNINPRLRIKDALNFFLFRLLPLGILGIILAILGY